MRWAVTTMRLPPPCLVIPRRRAAVTWLFQRGSWLREVADENKVVLCFALNPSAMDDLTIDYAHARSHLYT